VLLLIIIKVYVGKVRSKVYLTSQVSYR
jgi:hypothetical protein